MYNRYCCNCNGYIQHKNLKRYCRVCLDINKGIKTLDAVHPIIIEDNRDVSRTVQINLHKLHEYLRKRYNITEDIEDFFNLWLKHA